MKTFEEFLDEEIKFLPTVYPFTDLAADVKHFTYRMAQIRYEFYLALRELSKTNGSGEL